MAEFIEIKTTDLLKMMEDDVYFQINNATLANKDEKYRAEIWDIYSFFSTGMTYSECEHKMLSLGYILAEYGGACSEQYVLFTKDGNRYSDGIFFYYGNDFIVNDIIPTCEMPE